MSRDMTLPGKGKVQEDVNIQEEVKEEEVQGEVEETKDKKKPITKEESEHREKVFFEDDEAVRLRDGRTYRLPPLALKPAKDLMKRLNSIDTSIIIANLIDDEEGESRYDELLDILLVGFKPYYKDMTVEYLEEYVDIVTAKEIIDILIGLNGLKKSL